MSSINRGHTGLTWGGRGSNPRPTDYESADKLPRVFMGTRGARLRMSRILLLTSDVSPLSPVCVRMCSSVSPGVCCA